MQVAIMSEAKKHLFLKLPKKCSWENFEGRVDSTQGLEGIQDSIPSTPKEMLLTLPLVMGAPILKKGMPFNLTSEDETKIIRYVTEIRSIGLVLSATDVMRCEFHAVKKSRRGRVPV
jgi:hypothetical protein